MLHLLDNLPWHGAAVTGGYSLISNIYNLLSKFESLHEPDGGPSSREAWEAFMGKIFNSEFHITNYELVSISKNTIKNIKLFK